MKSSLGKSPKLSPAGLVLAFAHAVAVCVFARAVVAEAKTMKLHGKYAKTCLRILSANIKNIKY